jgi:acetate kinase
VSDAVLVLNAGSSSVKFSVFPGHMRPRRQDLICDVECEGIRHRVHFTAKDHAGSSLVDEHLAEGTTHEDALAALLRWLEEHFKGQRLVRQDIGWCMAGRAIRRLFVSTRRRLPSCAISFPWLRSMSPIT